jgi:hypothetical protein
MINYDWLQNLASKPPYNPERKELYEAYFLERYRRRFKNKNRHGKLKK